MADHTWTPVHPRIGIEVEVSGQEQWVIGRQRTPHVGGLQGYVDNGGGDDDEQEQYEQEQDDQEQDDQEQDDQEQDEQQQDEQQQDEQDQLQGQEQDEQQQELILQQDDYEQQVLVQEDDNDCLQYDERAVMAKLQAKIQGGIESMHTVIQDFQENFANGNVGRTRHGGGTLMMHYYPPDHHEYTWDEDKTIASFKSFDDLPWAVKRVQECINIYVAQNDYEDFYVGDVSVHELSLAWYEDYAHLVSVWRAYVNLEWITKQQPVVDLEYNKMKTVIYSDALKGLLNQFQVWFERLEALSGYEFQVLEPDDQYRRIVARRLRGCMNWKVFLKAEKAKHLNKYSPTSSFDALFSGRL